MFLYIYVMSTISTSSLVLRLIAGGMQRSERQIYWNGLQELKDSIVKQVSYTSLKLGMCHIVNWLFSIQSLNWMNQWLVFYAAVFKDILQHQIYFKIWSSFIMRYWVFLYFKYASDSSSELDIFSTEPDSCHHLSQNQRRQMQFSYSTFKMA